MKRIAVFNRFFSTTAGGAESYSVALANALSKALVDKSDAAGEAKYEVHVFAQHIDPAISALAPKLHLHTVPWGVRRPRWINQFLFALYTWFKTRKDFVVISHENTWHGQIQVVHVRPIRYNLFFPSNLSLTGWRLALRWFKVVTSPRLLTHLWLEGSRMKTPHVVPVSEISKMQIEKAYPALAGGELQIITPGVAAPREGLTQSMARAQLLANGVVLDASAQTLLFVANDYERKGLDALLHALVGVIAKYPHVQLLVVGKPSQQAKYQALAQQLGIAACVHFVGTLSDMGIAYTAADVMVHPTLEDAFPMVVMEAMSHGLPVIVSDVPYCGSSAHFRHEGDVLLLADPKDAVKLGQEISRVLADQTLREQLKAGAQSFVKDYDWAHISAKFEALIDSINATVVRP